MTTVHAEVRVTGRRIVATIIDSIILSAAFGATYSDSTTRPNTGLTPWYVVGAGLYYIVMEAFLGRTVGKMLTGIKVVDETTGRPPGLLAAILRTVLRLIDGLAGYLVGFVVVVNSRRRRRLGDMAAHTLVVRT